jgi:Zn-dependent protease with chaperone function
MVQTLPEAVEPYPDISSKAYEHPADRAATAALQSIPVLDKVVRKLVEYGYERSLRQSYLGDSIKVSERQLPELYASYTGVHRILDMPGNYDLYVTGGLGPLAWNALTIGSQNPMLVMGSPLLAKLGAGEQRAVLGHELGHILSDHVMYMTALQIILRAGGSIGLLGLPLVPVRAVLLEWVRTAELSCDRAAVLAVRDPKIICRTLMVLAGGVSADKLDLDAFMAQAMEYDNWEDGHDRVRRFFTEIGRTHANAVRRVSEIMRWVQSGEYDRIQRGEYRKRSDPVDVRDEAGDAFDFYSERFRGMFSEMGDSITNLGNQVGNASSQVADWLRNRNAGNGGGSGGGS